MVRTYVRKTTRGAGGNWTHENLLLAVEAVRSKSSSTNQAAVNFGIPEPTLRRYICKSPDRYPLNNGRYRPVFSEHMEKALVEYILEVSVRFYGMTSVQLRQLAFEFAERNQLRHNFDRSARAAGADWLAGFLKRNQEISLRMPEMMSLARMQGFNQVQVKKFFDLLTELYQKHNFAPSRIYNVDETGVPTVPTKLPKILSLKGMKRVGKIVSAERGKTVTLVCSMNAAGNFIPPAFVFPRVRMCKDFLDSAPPESLAMAHKSGWMTKELFAEYLQHFAKHTKPSAEDPVLLIVDNHTSHLSLAAIEYCRKHSIVMLTLPPHGSHMMQPLDVTFFGPFKTFYSQACDNWVVNHPGRPITERQVAMLVNEAFDRAATAGNARRGFEQTGIWPFNTLAFSASDFAPSLNSERPPVAQQPSVVLQSACSSQMTMQSGQSSSAADIPQPVNQSSPVSLAVMLQSPTARPPQDQAPSSIITPQAIRPYPVDSRVLRQDQSGYKRKSRSAVVATSTPHKAEVEAAEQAKKNKDNSKLSARGKQPKKTGVARKLYQTDTTTVNKTLTSVAGKQSRKKQSTAKKPKLAPNEDKTPCGYCHYIYGDSDDPLLDEEWVVCAKCKNWCHESCGRCVKRQFRCYCCSSDK